MKRLWIVAVTALLLTATAASPGQAASQWNMAYVGRMTLPKHVTFDEGEQSAIPFLQSKGIKWSFIRNGMMDGKFYTMTFSDGVDFSYGWAASSVVGMPYLMKQGESRYRDKTPVEQMDVIAKHINENIRNLGADYSGETPLKRLTDKGRPSWEGAFIVTRKEKDITYREAYQMVLQVSGFRVVLGIINSDADNEALTGALAQMVKSRTFYKEKDLIKAFLRNS